MHFPLGSTALQYVLLIIFFIVLVSTADMQSDTIPGRSRAEIEILRAIRTTIIYSSSATLCISSICQLAANHNYRPSILRLVPCIALSLGVGIIIAATHSRLTYTDDVWGWIEKYAGESWARRRIEVDEKWRAV